MYQSPSTMELMAGYRQDELLREAGNQSLAREATAGHDQHSSAQHRLVTMAVVVLLILTAVVLI